MEKTRKSPLITILKVLLVLAIVIVAFLVAGYFLIKNVMGIDIIALRRSLKALNKLPDQTTYISNPYTEADYANARQKFADVGLGAIIGEDGLNEYFSALEENDETYESLHMTSTLSLTDKELASVLNKTIAGSINSSLSQDQNFSIELLEVKFSDVTKSEISSFNKTQANVEIILKFNITSFAKGLKKFPLSILTKYLPDIIYAKVNFTITNAQEDFEYVTEVKSLNLNALSEKDTAKLINQLAFMDIGTVNNVANIAVEAFTGILFKNSDGEGIFSSLNYAGAKDYEFVTVDGTQYLNILTAD